KRKRVLQNTRWYSDGWRQAGTLIETAYGSRGELHQAILERLSLSGSQNVALLKLGKVLPAAKFRIPTLKLIDMSLYFRPALGFCQELGDLQICRNEQGQMTPFLRMLEDKAIMADSQLLLGIFVLHGGEHVHTHAIGFCADATLPGSIQQRLKLG